MFNSGYVKNSTKDQSIVLTCVRDTLVPPWLSPGCCSHLLATLQVIIRYTGKHR